MLGATALVLERHQSESHAEVVHSYDGNIVVSFAMYCVVALMPLPTRFGKLLTAALALAVVNLFEALKAQQPMMAPGESILASLIAGPRATPAAH